MKRKIILFGGTFDPIHYGHTIVAAAAAEKTGSDEVVFIPAKRSPHKQQFPVADGSARFEMITLAIAGNSKFRVSERELQRPEPSYTLDTVKSFECEYEKAAEFYWLIGADVVKDLPKWYRICDLIDMCNLSVMCRAGFEKPAFSGFEKVWGTERIKKLQQNVILTPLIDISSTEIRRKIACCEDITALVAPDVAAYIAKNRLYRSKPGVSD